MKKYESIQKSKLASSYGGIGSIIETKDNGSLLVSDFNDWPFYQLYINSLIQHENRERLTRLQEERIPAAKESLIDESRLLKRLQDKGFVNIRGLFAPPVIESTGYSIRRADNDKLMLTDYFPKWFYCPHCRGLAHLNEWRAWWNEDFPNNQTPGIFDKNPPSCSKCSRQIKQNQFRRKYLEQVRFVLASMDNGEVRDLPWDLLVTAQPEVHGQFLELRFRNNRQRSNTEMKYRTSPNTDSLYGIFIESGNIRKNMAEVERINFIDSEGHAYKVLIKNSTNIYFPITVSSIQLPTFVPTSNEIAILNNLWNNLPANSKNPESLAIQWQNNANLNNLRQMKGRIIQRLIECNFNLTDLFDYQSDDNYLFDEYSFITDDHNYSGNFCDTEYFISEKILCEDSFFAATKIKALYCLHKLKETVVQVSYKRIDNSSTNVSWYNSDDHAPRGKRSFEKHTCSFNRNDIKYMPAVENFGEGLFLEFEADQFMQEDIEKILHTYCHVIMKELEFECGYPLVSLKERLYFLQNHNAYGFMIYTINGSDSSYGGITSLFPDKIKNLIKNAIIRSGDCPNDPICYSEKGQCFACVDLPETSCEIFNDSLDRVKLINSLKKKNNQKE